MKVTGEKLFQISQQQLWKMLMDPDVLAKITPGIAQLEQIDHDTYKTVSKIKIGPVGGEFKGDLKVVEKDEPHSFVLEMKQLSKIGNADVRVHMNLSKGQEDETLLGFDGKAKLSGVIARTGQRVMSGVANSITKEVFESLEKHIEETQNDTDISESPSSEGSDGVFDSLLNWLKSLFR